MNRLAAITVALLALVLVITVGCGSNGDGTDGRPIAPPNETSSPTGDPPSEFDTLRGELAGKLDAFGVSIGVLPDDIRRQLLDSCHQLEEFADPEQVRQICDGINQAVERDDPGLIDVVLGWLADLEGN